ncbi:Na+/H+ antiporter subunit E [Mycolicibacterium parafortuitum]|uniref:Na+/H+ antiporter subunit E n=1 Tax=Mycolicibacterium parafortuitum TaxID=39692 RepID=A0A7I7U0E6_MYCPF|nr:Na+/H+ antiporter subunit E [Mycolicibacterium parafortuitum]PQE01533.1 Na+/H+ antiporter subunit E [Mycobacterium sp. EPG1]BBY73856.1 Na+/H+ antiporter subunit E [Mycolicibacterium parafortuitum]
MRHNALRIWIVCWLVFVWVLLWGNISAANLLSGLAVALVITVLLPLPPVPVEGRMHPLSTLRLVVTVAYWLVVSSMQVAYLAIKPGKPPLTAVLRAHLNVKSDLVLALAVNIMNLTPGNIVLEIDQTRRMVYVHVLDVGSDRTVNRFYSQVEQLQRMLVASFERDADWKPAAEKEADA